MYASTIARVFATALLCATVVTQGGNAVAQQRAVTAAQVDASIKSDRLKPNDAMRLLASYEKALKGYTYLQFSHPAK